MIPGAPFKIRGFSVYLLFHYHITNTFNQRTGMNEGFISHGYYTVHIEYVIPGAAFQSNT